MRLSTKKETEPSAGNKNGYIIKIVFVMELRCVQSMVRERHKQPVENTPVTCFGNVTAASKNVCADGAASTCEICNRICRFVNEAPGVEQAPQLVTPRSVGYVQQASCVEHINNSTTQQQLNNNSTTTQQQLNNNSTTTQQQLNNNINSQNNDYYMLLTHRLT